MKRSMPSPAAQLVLAALAHITTITQVRFCMKNGAYACLFASVELLEMHCSMRLALHLQRSGPRAGPHASLTFNVKTLSVSDPMLWPDPHHATEVQNVCFSQNANANNGNYWANVAGSWSLMTCRMSGHQVVCESPKNAEEYRDAACASCGTACCGGETWCTNGCTSTTPVACTPSTQG